MARSLANSLRALRGSQESIQEELHKDEGKLDSFLSDDILNDDEEYANSILYLSTFDEVVHGLESLADRLTYDIQQHNTLDEDAQRFMRLAYCQTHALLGSPKRTQYALESIYGHEEGVLVGSLEATSNTLKTIWEAIKKALITLADKIELMIERIIAGTAAIKERAKVVVSRAKQLGSKRAGGTMKATGTSIIHYRGKLDAPNVLQGLKNLNQTLSGAYDASDDVSTAYYSRVTTMANMLLKAKTDEEINFRLFETFHEISKEFSYRSPEFSGGWVFEPSEVQSADAQDASYRLVRDNPAVMAIEVTVAIPTALDIDRMGNEVIRIANALNGARTRLRAIRREQAECIKAVDRLMKESDAAFTERVVSRRLASKTASYANKTIAAPLAKLNTISAQVARSALVYCEQALVRLEAES